MSAPTATAAPVRSRRKAALGWVALVVGLLVVALVGGTLVFGGYTQRAILDPESAGPEGSRAAVRILEQQGVTVTVARDRSAAERALAGGGATLVMRDAPMLSDEGLRDLAGRAAHVVLVEPRSRALDVLLDGSALGGFSADLATSPECAVPAAANAGTARVGELLRHPGCPQQPVALGAVGDRHARPIRPRRAGRRHVAALSRARWPIVHGPTAHRAAGLVNLAGARGGAPAAGDGRTRTRQSGTRRRFAGPSPCGKDRRPRLTSRAAAL